MVWKIIFTVVLAGCVGGFLNSAITGEFKLPKKDEEAGVYRPGWMGNVFIGGIAALVYWGLNGPMASAVLFGEANNLATSTVLHVTELIGAVLSGVAGGRVLTNEVDKKFLVRESQELKNTKDLLTKSMQGIVKKLKGE